MLFLTQEKLSGGQSLGGTQCLVLTWAGAGRSDKRGRAQRADAAHVRLQLVPPRSFRLGARPAPAEVSGLLCVTPRLPRVGSAGQRTCRARSRVAAPTRGRLGTGTGAREVRGGLGEWLGAWAVSRDPVSRSPFVMRTECLESVR